MFKIGFMHPNGGGATPISLSPVNWPNALAINTTTTSSGLITWAEPQTTVTLRVVSSNIQQNPFSGNTNGTFRILTNTSNTTTGATITTYTSLDFNITVNKNTYMWFRLGPAEVSRDVTVYNASNNDILLDTVTITAGPFVTPIFPSVLSTKKIGGSVPQAYDYQLQTIQVSNVPTTTNVFLNWYLTSGSYTARVFYAKNYPGITTTGTSNISSSTLTPDLFTPAFTEIITPGNTLGGGVAISVANGDFLTFIAFSSAGASADPVPGSNTYLEVHSQITNNTSQVIASTNIKTYDS